MKRNSINQNSSEHGNFSFENSKLYISALILLFHILPLMFIGGGETGRALLNSYGLLVFNPLIITVTMIIYGIKHGFNCKMPLICLLLSVASVAMYYSFKNISYMLTSVIVFLIVYAIYAFIAIGIGSFIKKLF